MNKTVTRGIKLAALGVGVMIAGVVPTLFIMAGIPFMIGGLSVAYVITTLGKLIFAAGLILIVIGVVQSIMARRRNRERVSTPQ